MTTWTDDEVGGSVWSEDEAAGTALGAATGSSLVGFVQSGSDPLSQSVQAKERKIIHASDYTGYDATGATDSGTAITNAIAAAVAAAYPTVHINGVPKVGSAISIASNVRLVGDGIFTTSITRNFSGASDAQGIFNVTGGADLVIEGMTLKSASGTTGGCLVSAVADANNAPSVTMLNVDLTTAGTDTHKYALHIDGSLKDSGSLGVRDCALINVQAFGGTSGAALIKSVVNFTWQGGHTFSAGGTSGALEVTGTAGVPSKNIAIALGNCAALTLDRLQYANFNIGNLGNVTNTANVANVVLMAATLGTLQTNWTASHVINANGALNLRAGQMILNPDSLAGALQIGGNGNSNIYLGQRSGTTTKVGYVGNNGGGFAVPDTKTFTFTIIPTGCLFIITDGGGRAVCLFANNASATISILSDPSTFVENSATPTAGKIGVFKSAGSSVISVINSVGSQRTLGVICLGPSSAVTDPA